MMNKSKTMKFLEELTGGPLTTGTMLRIMREVEDLSVSEVAYKLSTTNSIVMAVENGTRPIYRTSEEASRWAQVLGYPKDFFWKMASSDPFPEEKKCVT